MIPCGRQINWPSNCDWLNRREENVIEKEEEFAVVDVFLVCCSNVLFIVAVGEVFCCSSDDLTFELDEVLISNDDFGNLEIAPLKVAAPIEKGIASGGDPLPSGTAFEGADKLIEDDDEQEYR